MAQVEMEIDSVRVVLYKYERAINLKEKAGERYLPILIDASQGDMISLARNLEDMWRGERLRHEFELLGADLASSKIESVIINQLDNNAFHAKLVVSNYDKSREVDCPLAKAIAFALAREAPIFVDEAVLCKAATPVSI